MRIKKLITVLCCILILSVLLSSFVACNSPKNSKDCDKVIYLGENSEFKALEKQVGKDFKIMLFTDIQLWMNVSDDNSAFAMMDKLVEEENPDLIILPGDNVSGFTTKIYLNWLIKKMESYKIPWAPVYGNHDMEGTASIKWQSSRYEGAEYCLFDRGPEDLYGMGNYALNIVEDGNIINTLFFMDNGRYHKYANGVKKEVYIEEEQIAWYENTAKAIAQYQGEAVPSMVFSHTAMPEMREAVEKLCPQNPDDKFYYVPQELGFGYFAYLPGVAPINTGFIDRAKAVGLTHVFCGHDHESNGSILYEGVRYTYGLKTGKSPKPWNDAKSYGATIIEIGDNASISIRNNVQWSA